MGPSNNSSFTSCIKSAGSRVLSGGPVYLLILCFLSVLFIAGCLIGIHSVFITGSRHAYGTYREIPLALLISTYMFFVVTSTGLCFISSIGYVFGISAFLPVAKRLVMLALITLVAGFVVIGLEIENPLRMAIYLFYSPNLTSNIWWMGVLYLLYMVFILGAFIFLWRSSHRPATFLGLMGVLCGLAAIGVEGGIFAMLYGRPVWYGPFLPVYMLVVALMSGCAFTIFFGIVARKISGIKINDATEEALALVCKLAMLLIAAMAYLTIWKMIPMTVGGETRMITLREMISGSHAFSFWVLEVACGMVIPFVLLLSSRGRKQGLMLVAACFMILSIFFMRLDMVVLGQIVPVYWEFGVKEFSQLLTYTPTWQEILVALGGVGFCGAAFMLGEKIFYGWNEDHCAKLAKGGKADIAP